jgi:hypothetical protein
MDLDYVRNIAGGTLYFGEGNQPVRNTCFYYDPKLVQKRTRWVEFAMKCNHNAIFAPFLECEGLSLCKGTVHKVRGYALVGGLKGVG